MPRKLRFKSDRERLRHAVKAYRLLVAARGELQQAGEKKADAKAHAAVGATHDAMKRLCEALLWPQPLPGNWSEQLLQKRKRQPKPTPGDESTS